MNAIYRIRTFSSGPVVISLNDQSNG